MERSEKNWRSIGIKPLDIELLNVDRDHYQRQLTPIHKAIIGSFDERKLGTIAVSKRADGTYWIIDGQNRWAACRALGRKTMRCEVYEGCTVEDEAAIFSGLDDRRALTPFSKFRARVCAGSPAEAAIERIFAAREQSLLSERFRAPKCALWVYQGCGGLSDQGPAVLVWAVNVYLKAWPAPKSASEAKSWIDGPMLKGIGAVGAKHPDVAVAEMARKLAEVTPDYIKASALAMGGGDLTNRIAFVVVNRYNHKRPVKTCLPQWVISTRFKRAA